MQKLIFLLILLFPTFTFGQNYAGDYRAIFYNLSSTPITILAEFEIKPDNSISAKVKIGDDIKILNGSVDRNGKFEVASVAEGNLVYKLKGKFDKNNKISFIRRTENRATGSKSVSENGLEGTFAKVEKVVETKPVPAAIDSKNNLSVKLSNPFFTNQWTEFTAKIITKKGDTVDTFDLELTSDSAEGERKFSAILPIYSNKQKVWKSSEFTWIIYTEKIKKPVQNNRFSATFENYQQKVELQVGQIEIVGENVTQIIFKLANVRVKRIGKDDFVEINGTVYAEKMK